MTHKLKVFKDIIVVIAIAGTVVTSPYIYFEYQEREMLNTVKEIPIEVLKLEYNNQEELDLEQRREMIYKEDKDIEKITLHTGDVYSLYEARKQCYRELREIPILEMDLYGPLQKEIEISPQLIVDSKIPAYSMIIWSGTLTIKDVLYEIILDEESGKLLHIQAADDNAAENRQLQESLENEWKIYFYD